MGKAIYTMTLDVQSTVSQATVYAKQGDTNRQIHFIFRNEGAPYEISENDLLVLSAKTPEGKTIEESVSVIGGEAIYDFSQALTASVGMMDVEIRLYKAGEIIISPSFTLVVEARVETADDVVAHPSYTALDETYKGVSALKAGLEEVTARAEGAASDASLAADSANTKAMIAEGAASNATDAANRAGTAAGNAITAASTANTAAARANAAADKINTYKTITNEQVREDGSKVFSEMRLEPGEAHLTQGVNYGDDGDTTDLVVSEGKVKLIKTVGGEELPVDLKGVATPDGTDPTQAVNVQYLKGRSDEVDPVFANNSWELIKWICRHDDPSKYWKVGDYKPLCFGKKLVATNLTPNTEGWYEGDYVCAKNYETILAFFDWDKFVDVIDRKVGTYTIKAPQVNFAPPFYVYDEEGTKIWEGNSLSDLGASIADITASPDEWTVIVGDEKLEYPLQIIGFNHDKVTNPYEYGKQRAGMTLQLGCSRSNKHYGDTRATLFEGVIDGIMSSNGKYYKSPNKVLTDYSEGATNWANGGFRIALQSMFDNTEIAAHIVEVQKYTSQYFSESNYWCAPMLTADKVFLPSEWEMFGVIVHSPAQEGDQYEYYKDGYSKFMWHKDLLNGVITKANLWLRSAQGASVNVNLTDNTTTCAVYLNVKSYDPLSVNYTPSAAASETRAGLIAPCICI